MFFSVLCLLCLCARLFVCALWPPAGKGLTSWLSFVVSNCECVTFLLVSWVRCGTELYRFLIFAPLLTFTLRDKHILFQIGLFYRPPSSDALFNNSSIVVILTITYSARNHHRTLTASMSIFLSMKLSMPPLILQSIHPL